MLSRTAHRAPGVFRGLAARGFATSVVRNQVKLPDLPYDYGALEPAISGKIMELHYTKHHQTYVTNYNAALEKYESALDAKDVKAQIALQPAIRFNGGGHINHSLFWENLTPAKSYEEPSGPLAKAIDSKYGSLDKLQTTFNGALAGIQGSGWGWLVKKDGELQIVTTPNQDPVTDGTVLLGIDAWEHAYYLQYQNVKADYFKAIWGVLNWKTVEERYGK